MDRVSVAEAAHRLGISQDAVYKRIKRGTIPWNKGEDDKTYVWIGEVDGSTDRARPSTDRASEPSNYVSKDDLLSEMRARVSFLEEELQRKDAILLSLTQRIPELEPAKDSSSEPRESSKKATEEFYGTHAPPSPSPPQRAARATSTLSTVLRAKRRRNLSRGAPVGGVGSSGLSS
jgi:hypothetical protein